MLSCINFCYKSNFFSFFCAKIFPKLSFIILPVCGLLLRIFSNFSMHENLAHTMTFFWGTAYVFAKVCVCAFCICIFVGYLLGIYVCMCTYIVRISFAIVFNVGQGKLHTFFKNSLTFVENLRMHIKTKMRTQEFRVIDLNPFRYIGLLIFFFMLLYINACTTF